MIKIDKIYIQVDAHMSDDSNKLCSFGREVSFSSGLNLIVGDNTSGKTTIAKCLYYALGMEELIGGKAGTSFLDKSVTTTFRQNDEYNCQQTTWIVEKSSVYLQLTNGTNNTITICRKIKDICLHDNVLTVWNDPFNVDMSYANSREYYIHRVEDHNKDFNIGFYGMLSKFADIDIIDVPSRGDKDTKLYLQTFFALCFIEQTKGWSDFFATIKSFNIFNPKQRIIEYAMGYDVDGECVLDKRLKDQKKNFGNEWSKKAREFKNYLSFNNIFVETINDDISKQSINISELRFAIRDKGVAVNDYINECKQRIEKLNTKQHKTSSTNEEYNQLYAIYQKNKEQYEQFCLGLIEEQEKLSAISKQLYEIKNEIRRYKSLAQVNNIITGIDIKICPTCNQPMHMSDANSLAISSEQISFNKDQLEMQKGFLEPLLKKLELSVNNKRLYQLYLDNNLLVEKDRLLSLAKDNDINLLPLSQVEQIELVDLRNQVSLMINVQRQIDSFTQGLDRIYTAYSEIINKIGDLKQTSEATPIEVQLSHFRKLLREFGYTSNSCMNIFLKEDKMSSYRYLPTIIQGDYEEYIRSYSSASDFIRSIWAYYITLLQLGKNHPGFLILDEPCQHSMKESSLKALFEISAGIKDKQIILFCSSQPHTAEALESEGVSKIDNNDVIKTIVESLDEQDNVNYISIDPYAIMSI